MAATNAARRTLHRGYACLALGGAFALPVVGSTAVRPCNVLLSLLGLRYGGVHLS